MKVLQPLRNAGKAAAMALALSALMPAQAGTALWCQGTFENHWIDAIGTVYVTPNWRGDHIALCNVNTTMGGITATVCLGWTAIIRAAMQKNATTIVHYSDAPVTACSLMPTYTNAPLPSYVLMYK
jgi:hypothetical protein